MYVLDRDHRQLGQLSSPFPYFQFGIGLDKYLLTLLTKLLCTKTLSQISGYRHMTLQRSTASVPQPKNSLDLAHPLQ